MSKVQLIAHRGYATKYPENSLQAIKAAIDAGIKFVEFDIQVTNDRVPVLLHDGSLERVGADERVITDIPFDEINTISVHDPERFGDQFETTPLASLQEVVTLLQDHPDVTAFIDIKIHSCERFNKPKKVTEAVLERIEPIVKQCVIVSKLSTVLLHAKLKVPGIRIGWVGGKWDTSARMVAEVLQPDFIFSRQGKLPESGPLPEGPWKWVVYDNYDTLYAEADLKAWAARGAHYVEALNAPELL